MFVFEVITCRRNVQGAVWINAGIYAAQVVLKMREREIEKVYAEPSLQEIMGEKVYIFFLSSKCIKKRKIARQLDHADSLKVKTLKL